VEVDLDSLETEHGGADPDERLHRLAPDCTAAAAVGPRDWCAAAM
jgi:hypothetical protein